VGNSTAVVLEDKYNVNIPTNMLSPPAEDNFYEEHGKSLKLAKV
jgi:hypothetical protein